jgi:hypothetical protein
MAMCVIAVVGAAPCQCFSPGSNQITSPGRISSIGPPQRCTRPQPAVTIKVWPSGWLCQAVRAPGSNVTLAQTTRAGSDASNRGSMRTLPVKYSAGPLPEGYKPLLVMSICSIPPLYFFWLPAWQLFCSLTVGSSLEEKSSLPAKAARHVLYLVLIIDAPSRRVVE